VAPAAEWPRLMARAQAGDHAAYNRLLRAMVPAIRAVVRKRIGDDGLVEDVIQDVLLSIHRVRHTYDPARPFLPWMATIAASRAIDAVRRRGRRGRWEVQDDDALHVHIDGDSLRPAETFAARDEVDGLLNRLPDRQREIVELVHLQDMSLKDAASRSRLSITAVKALLHRAIVNLREYGAKDHG
jgi:RNA polymerase sigma-70 factor (ECF subfamily)